MTVLNPLRKLWHYSQKYREPYKTHWTLNYVLNSIPRNIAGEIALGNWKVSYLDAYDLREMWQLQFMRQYNDFFTHNSTPRILDCGSNIGISVLRYKHLYPDSHIIAFEPDAQICAALQKNVRDNNLSNVEVIEAAIWSEDSILEFESYLNTNSQAGRIYTSSQSTVAKLIPVTAVWLGHYLQESVDFLKLDIEGAELAVLESCQSLLGNVKQMMVEIHHRVDKPDSLIGVLEILRDTDFKFAIYQYARSDATKPFTRQENATIDQTPIVWAWRD